MQILAYGGNPTAWIIGFIVILVIFGGAKIPEMMKGLGQGMREFKKGINEEDDELRKEREKEERIRNEVRARMEEEERRERDSRSRAEEELRK